MDTIIVGGGLAGLTAARDLVSAGRSVVLLEGRTRLGGRAWTEYDNAQPTPFELGAEWLGEQGMLNDVLAAANVRVEEARGAFLRSRDGRLEHDANVLGTTARLIHRIKHLQGDDRSLADVLAKVAPDPDLADARAALFSYVQGFHAADPALLSARWLVEVEQHQSAADSQCRAVEGLGHGVDHLRRGLEGRCDIRLGTVVREVRWRTGDVDVLTDNGAHVHAHTALVTVPLPLLDPASSDDRAAVRFVPRLPEKEHAATLLHMGHALKLVLRFREPFWEDTPGFDNLGFLFALGERFPTWWRAGNEGSTVLAGWLGGPAATEFTHAATGAVLDAAVDSLARALGRSTNDVASQLVVHRFHDWTRDRFAMGAYTYVGVSGLDAHAGLARHVDATLFFAGEATCGGGLNATMEGAMQSGARAAGEILAILGA